MHLSPSGLQVEGSEPDLLHSIPPLTSAYRTIVVDVIILSSNSDGRRLIQGKERSTSPFAKGHREKLKTSDHFRSPDPQEGARERQWI
jgi:hypothetical protein